MDLDCNVSKDVVEKFKLALSLNDEKADEVIERLMKEYIALSFSKASNTYKVVDKQKLTKQYTSVNDEMGKALNRIPKWAMSPGQYNHKIVKAFFQVEKELGHVPLLVLERRCSDQERFPDTYVAKFYGNFNQMKTDAKNSHGKVFEIEGNNVVVWDYVKETLFLYKSYFFRDGSSRII